MNISRNILFCVKSFPNTDYQAYYQIETKTKIPSEN